MRDNEGRVIDYMRISLTDRCNLRCRYCMPAEGISLIEHEDILSYEEVLQIVRSAAPIGIKKIRLTGGEPLVRIGIVHLIEEIIKIEGIEEVSITTNGLLLDKMLDDLAAAGLDRVNLSLDTLNPATFEGISRFPGLNKIMRGFERCMSMGIPVKINAVILKGINDRDIVDLMRLTYKWPVDVRFIELMPIGCGKSFTGVSTEILLAKIIKAGFEYHWTNTKSGNGPANYIRLKGAKGEVGFISPLSHSFCGDCNRIRVTPEGFLKPCLYSKEGIDIRQALRTGVSQEGLTSLLKRGIEMKPSSHQFLQDIELQEQRLMSQIGG